MPLNIHTEQPEYSEEVQDIIGVVPHWLIRWGITLFFIVLMGILLLSAFIKSPDIVQAKLKVNSGNPPYEVIARKQGKLSRLFVRENQMVKQGEVLGYLESIADHKEVLNLSLIVDNLEEEMQSFNYDAVVSVRLNTVTHYGELQPAFQEFYLSVQQFKAYIPGGVYDQKSQVARNELSNLKALRSQLNNQKAVNEQDYAIAKKEYEAFRKLADAKVISPLEFKREESKFLNKQLPLQTSEAALISNNTAQNIKEKELLETESLILEQRASFLSKIQQFKSEIDNWKFQHILRSGREGRVVFNQALEENQWLELSKPVMFISAIKTKEPYGELILGQYSLGKVKPGQSVLIKLSAYPYQEYGLLRGKITYISDVLYGDTTYTAKVQLPEGLRSTYNKSLNLQAGLIAGAEIVTESRSLLSRVFSSFRSVVNNN